MKIKNLKSIALVLLCTMLNINYALGADPITKEWGLTSTSSDFTSNNCVLYFSQPYGMKQVNAYIQAQNLKDFKDYASLATQIDISVKCLQNGGSTSRLTIYLIDKDGTTLGSSVVTPDNYSSASSTTYKTVSFTSSLTNATGFKVQCTTFGKNILINGAKYSITYTAGPAYTITATRNNDSYGTVSVSGTKITATPNSGYRVMSGTHGYNVTSGTATVVNNGDNTFTVTPSSNCTVRINFESKGCVDHAGDNAQSYTGTGTGTGYTYGPVDAYYEYNTRQILYTKADLGLAAGKKGVIKSIYFRYAYGTAMSSKTSVKIYMANTSLAALSTSNYVTSFTEVYSGALNGSGNGTWNEIILDSPFNYDGIGNLVVVIDDNSNAYDGTNYVYSYHTASTTSGAQLYTRSASSDADPTAAATWTGATLVNYRPATKFCIQEQDMVACTVTFNAGTGSCGTSSLTELSAGAGITLPSASHSCDGWDFAGWANASVSSETTSKPTLYTAGSNYKPSSDETLYAVYKHTEGGGGSETYNFTQNESLSSAITIATGVTATFSIGTGSTAPTTQYGNQVRVYGNNTITIQGTGLTSITFTYTGSKTMTPSTGTIVAGVWSGSADEVTFSIASGSGNNQITAITIDGGGTTTYTTSARCNPIAQIVGTPWVTSTKDETVKIEVPVSATNFDANCTLSDPTVSGAGFAFVGWGAGGKNVTADTELETSIILSYTPSAYGTSVVPTNTATVTLGSNYSGGKEPSYPAGTVNGRSLPQKFLIIAKTDNGNKWWAVPSNMPTTSNTFAGVEVVPDNTTTPTVVPAGPYSALYSLTAVHADNYASEGQYVRFFSSGTNKMLWATSSDNTGIKNGDLYTSGTSGAKSPQYEWKASTENGRVYSLTCVGNSSATRGLKYSTGYSKFGYYKDGNASLYIVPVGCTTRAAVTAKDSTYNSFTLTWEGDPGQTYNLFVQYGGATEKTELLVSSPVTVSGLAHDNSEYTYILSPGAIDDACRLEGTIHTKVAPINVTLSCNGEATDLGAQDNPYVLPTTGTYAEDACDEWEFAGWYGSTYGVPTASSSAPTYITQLTSTGTAYAVYQHTEGDESDYTITFNDNSTDASTDITSSDLIGWITTNADSVSSASGISKCYKGATGLKLGSARNNGTVTLNLPHTLSISKVVLYTKRKGTGQGGANGVTVGSTAFSTSSSYSTDLTNIEFTGSTTSANSITITSTSTTSEGSSADGRVSWIKSITIYAGSATTTYSTTTDCCSEVEKPEVNVAVRAASATISWDKQVAATNGYNVKIPDASIDEDIADPNTTSYVATGLLEKTEYTVIVTAIGPTCSISSSADFKTEESGISVAEWATDAVYLDLGDMSSATALIEEQNTQAVVQKKVAENLFFSKYFEGDGSMKLLAIYNGTGEDKNLANYAIRELATGTTDSRIVYSLADLGTITDGQEVIFFSRPLSSEAGYSCSLDFLDDKAAQNKATDNPRWIECDGTALPKMIFNGNDAMELVAVSGSDSTILDRFGAVDAPSERNCRNEASWRGTIRNMDYKKTAADFPNLDPSEFESHGINLVDSLITAYTARVILFRDSSVVGGTGGATNTSDFTTFNSGQWNGRYICQTGKVTGKPTCNSFADLGEFDYNNYFAEYEVIQSGYSLSDHRQPDGTYKIEIPGLNEKSCTNLRITVTDGGGRTVTGSWQVPIMVATNSSTTDVLFTQEGDDCAKCDVVIMRNANLNVAAGGKNTVRNVEVYHSGQLNVPSDQTFNVNEFAMRSKEDTVPRADIQGNLVQHDAEQFTFQKRMRAGRWYKIALPYRCKISDVKFRNGDKAEYNTKWYLQTYDGDNRANGVQTGNWHIYTGEYMEPGVGYNVAIDGDILETGNMYAELKFPMTANTNFAEHATVAVPVNAWGANNSRTKGGDPVTPNHLGWNMIGNPYMLDYTTGSVTTPLTIGKLEMDGITWTLNNNGLRYVVALKSTRDSYEQIAIGAGKKEMEPFMAYFVQIDGSTDREALNITFAKGQQHGRSIVRRSRAQYEEVDTTPVWCAVNITNPLNEKDETTLLISDDFTEDYDMMNDFTKMRGDKYQEYSKPVLASRNTTGDMAFNAVPDSTAAKGVPLTFYTNQAGQFTFRMDFTYGLDKIQRVEIYDDNDKQWHSLMNGDEYSFYSDHLGDNTDRFRMRVVVDRKAPQITTDLEPTESENSAPSKLLINGHVYILRGGRIYDITGKQLR